MPGSARRQNVIDANMARRVSASKEVSTSSANTQNIIAQASLAQQDQYGKLAAEEEQFKEDKKNAAIKGLGDMATLEEGARDRQIAIAEGQISKGEAQKGAGQQNIAGGITSAAGSVGRVGVEDPATETTGISKRKKSASEIQYDKDKLAAEKEAKRRKGNRRGTI